MITGAAIGTFFLNLLKSKWTWIVILVSAIILLLWMYRSSLKDIGRYRQNAMASDSIASAKTFETEYTLRELNRYIESNTELQMLLKKEKVKPARIRTLYELKWTERVDTAWVEFHDTILAGTPAEIASLDTMCTHIDFIKEKDSTRGRFNYSYTGEITVIHYRTRPKPKFWNWIKGRWDYTVIVKSPCFGDKTVTFQKFTTVK